MGALDDITASLTADAKSFAMRKVVDYVAADPIGRLPQALTIIDKLDVRDILLPHRKAVRAIIESPDNNWNQLIRGLWEDVDPEVLRTFLQNVVVNGSIVGYPSSSAPRRSTDATCRGRCSSTRRARVTSAARGAGPPITATS